jgi:carboxylesterase
MVKQQFGVLVIHGFTASLDCVSGVEAAIEALGLPTRMPTLRGHGAESPEALRRVAWRDWVVDAQAALQDLLTEADRVIVFGHSMGGLVALTLAADDAAGIASGVIDSLVVAAAAVQLASPVAPGQKLSFLQPLLVRLFKKWDMPPTYADPALAEFDTNYAWAPTDAIAELLEFAQVTRRRLPEIRVPTLIMQSRRDTTVAPESAQIIYDAISTPPDQKRIAWFEVTEHEMFRDCEREATVQTVADYVKERTGI